MIIQCLTNTHVLSAERRYFGRKEVFRQEDLFRQKGFISAGTVHFGRKGVFRPKVMSFGRFRLSAEIYDLKILSFGSGRKPSG